MTFDASVRLYWKRTVLGMAAFGSLLGAVLSGSDLYRGIQEANSLYTVGVAGLSIEGELQQFTQESRRSFVYALATDDPNLQLPYVQQSRAADREVTGLHRRFEGLKLDPAARVALGQLDREWRAYLESRDEMISLILEGRSSDALELERTQGTPRFEACVRTLQSLKQFLDGYAERQLMLVRQTCYRAGLEIAFLIVTTLVFIGTLQKVAALRRTHDALTLAEKLERQRSQVLELVSRNSPLPEVLTSIANLVERQYPAVRCALALLHEGMLSYIAAPNLPEEYVRATNGTSVQDGTISCTKAARSGVVTVALDIGTDPGWLETRDMLLACGAQACWSVPVRSARDKVLGTVAIYGGQSRQPDEDELNFLGRIARLTALAIEHREANDQLAFQARHDALTGLPNRIMLHDRVEQALRSAHPSMLAILWIDLDRFKPVNDILGHHAGDILLQQVSQRLRGCVRDSDTVARIGGDEFVVLLTRFEREDLPEEIAQRVVEELGCNFQVLNQDVQVTASVGISRYPEHGHDAESLLRNADRAMYCAKFNGKNTFAVYTSSHESASSDSLDVQMHLRAAVQKGDFEVAYQPQIDRADRMVGVEALLRWNSPVLGSVAPARFIPVAEETGLIIPLGTWVLREACRQAAAWGGVGFGDLAVAVNVSAIQFAKPDFADTVESALAASGLDPRRLELELTETLVMRDLEESVRQMCKLRGLGVKIAIDDFGTGNSCLSYLRQLPVDTLKIDRSFIHDMNSPSSQSLSVVRAIIGLAHGLGLRVVAEGVETSEQLALLKGEGCDVLQGFLLHRPMPAAEISGLLHASAVEGESEMAKLLLLDHAAAAEKS